MICHACESRHPELLILLDSRFRGNDDLYDKIAQFRYNVKRPHPKAEELDRLSRRTLPSLMITTQSLWEEG